MKEVPGKGYRLLLLVCEFDFRGVEVRVEFATDGQSCGGCGAGDEINDRLIGLEWPPAPVLGDSGEEPVLDLVKAPG